MTIHNILFIVMICAVPLTLNAETVYKWLDEDGRVNYSSHADDESAEEVELEVNANNSKKHSTKKIRDDKQKNYLKSLENEKKSIEEEKLNNEKEAELAIERCKASKEQLKRIENSRSLYGLEDKETKVFLAEKQYAQALNMARSRVEKWCK